MAAPGRDRGIFRVQEKLNIAIAAGKYYEAHQMYKTLYFRLLGQSKYSELLEMLEKGAKILLEHDQKESGADLAILFIDVLVKSKTPVDEDWITKVSTLFGLMSSSMPERETYVYNATKWSMAGGNTGHPLFHSQIAKIYWQQNNCQTARQHFLRSSDGASFANMIIEIHTSRGFHSEVDIFIAQAVLQVLCLKSYELALDTFNNYTKNHPDILKEDIPFDKPLLNFIFFLLKCIEYKNAELFKDLIIKYDGCLQKDLSYSRYLEKIGNIYFDIPLKPKQRSNGIFGNIFQSFMSGLEGGDSGSSDEEGASAKNTSVNLQPDLD